MEVRDDKGAKKIIEWYPSEGNRAKGRLKIDWSRARAHNNLGQGAMG